MKIGFGYRVPQYGSTWEDVIATAQRAEALGFDGLWLNDHFVPDPYSGRYEASTFECWTAAGALAANTTEIRLGFMTLCNAYRLPQIAAKMATSLDVISGGRIDLGIGAGWHEDEFRMYGIPYPSAGVRLDQLEEALEIVHGMFDNEKFSFTGVHYQIDGAWNNPRPIQEPRPPVWIGGGGEKRMLGIVARHADWHNLVVTPLDVFKHKMEVLDGHCERIGRDPETLGRSLNPSLLLRDSEAEFNRYVAERAERRAIPTDAYLNLLQQQGTIFGGPERASEMLQQFVEAGCRYFEFILREQDQIAALERFADLVMPGFR